MKRSVLIGLLVLGACSSLKRIEANECGNGVVEAGEDCDRFPDSELGPNTVCAAADQPNECHYIITGMNDDCPLGWNSGLDNVCRFSSGSYEPFAPPLELASLGLAAVDIDGDSYPDIAGFSGSQLSVQFTSPTGGFDERFDFSLVVPNGAPAFADLDNDGRDDLVVPTFEGIFVGLGQETRSILPLAYSTFIFDSNQTNVRAIPVAPLPIAGIPPLAFILFLEDNGNNVEMNYLQGASGQPWGPPPTAVPGSMGDTGRIPIANIHRNAIFDREQEFALWFRGDRNVHIFTTAQEPTCMATLPPENNGFDCFRPVLLQIILMPTAVTAGVMFADVDGDGSLDVMAAVNDGTSQHEVAVSYGNGFGGFGPANVDTRFDDLVDTTLIGSPITELRSWPLAAGDVDGDGAADYVGQDAVYVSTGAGLFPRALRNSSSLWNEAVIADFNGDGFNDVGATAEVSGVDFLMGDGGGFFNRARVATEFPPGRLRVGDFDGDFVTDLVITSSTLGQDNAVSVLFGARQGPPLPPVFMGTLENIRSIEPALTVTRVESLDVTTDLVVQSVTTGQTPLRTLAFMLGSTERRMVSLFRLENANQGRAVTVGNFDGDDIPDLITVDGKVVVLIRGAGEGEFEPALESFALANPLDVTCTLWIVGDLEGGGSPDEVVFIDGAAGCSVVGNPPNIGIARVTNDQGSITLDVSIVTSAGTRRVPNQVVLADLDGDKLPELIISYAGTGAFPPFVGAGVEVYWNTGGSFDANSPAIIGGLDESFKELSVAAINADDDPNIELAVFTQGGVFIAEFDTNRQLTLGTTRVLPGRGGQIVIADINRDGVDDIILGGSNTVRAFVGIPGSRGGAEGGVSQ